MSLLLVILAAAVLVAYAGIAISSSADLLLAAGEVAVIAALAITILVKTGPAHYSAAVFSPRSSLHGQFSDITKCDDLRHFSLRGLRDRSVRTRKRGPGAGHRSG